MSPVKIPTGTRICSSEAPSTASSGRLTSMQIILSWSSRLSTRPFMTTMASSASRAPIWAITLGKTNTSIEALRSSRMKVAISSPRFVYRRTRAVTTPPTVRT